MRFHLLVFALLFYSPLGGQVVSQNKKFEEGLEQARQLANNGNTDQATTLCNELLSLLDTASDRSGHASLLTLEGTIARTAGDLKTAISLHQRALSMRQIAFGKMSEQASSSHLNLGNCQLQMGAYKEAAQHLNAGISIKKKLFGENDPRLINNLNSLGTCHEKMGAYRPARDCFSTAIRIGEIAFGENGTALVPLFTNLSNLYLIQDMPDSALALLNKALQIQAVQGNGPHPSEAMLYDKMGLVFQKKGNYPTAQQHFRKAISIYAQLPSGYQVDQAGCLQNLGNCLLEQGNTRSAILLFNQAGHLYQGNPVKQAGNLNSLGLAHLYMGLPEEAAEVLNQAMGTLYGAGMEGTDPALHAGILQNLGSCLLAQKEYATALKMYSEAAKYSPGPSFNILSKMADCQIRLGQFDAAKTAITNARSATPNPPPMQLFTYHYLRGNIFFGENKYPQAVAAFKEAINTLNGGQTNETPFPYETIQAHTALAMVFAKNKEPGHWGKALDFSTKSIEELEKLKGQITNYRSGNILQDIFHEPYQIAVQACLEMGQPEKAFEFSERYRGNFLRQLAFRTSTNVQDSTAEEWRSLEVQMAVLKKERFLRNNDPFDGQDLQEIGRLDSAILALSLQQQLLEKEATFPNQAAYLPLRDIQQLLQPDETLLQYHWGIGGVMLFVVSKNNLQSLTISGTSGLAGKITELYRLSSLPYDMFDAASTQQNFEAWTTISYEIYQTVLSPAMPFIKGHRLVVVPDGLFCYLPFELLLQTKPREPSFFRAHNYLIRGYEIRYLHAASLLKTKAGMHPGIHHPNQLLALAPSFADNSLGLQPLKNNVLELETILSKMDGIALEGPQATEGNYLKKLAQSQVIHFSTHGILNDRAPEFSYLAFSEISDSIENERLFVSEISNEPTTADLIVLSACQTAAGRLYGGEGLASIAQAFLHAGARSLVASLWNVDDQETPTLMGHFYGGLSNGLSKPAALRQAQLAYLEKANHKKAHPYYWAGFVHFGDAAPLELDAKSTWSGKFLTWWWLPISGIFLTIYLFWQRRGITPKNKQS